MKSLRSENIANSERDKCHCIDGNLFRVSRDISLTVSFINRAGRNETYDAFHAKSSMNAAPNVPVKNDAARSPALFFGTPLGSRPIIKPAPKIVGSMQISMTEDRSCHLSDKYPTKITQTAPIAPPGTARMSACWDVYPNVVRRMLEKLEMPPLGIELSIVQRQTSQTRMSLKVSKTCSFFKCAF